MTYFMNIVGEILILRIKMFKQHYLLTCLEIKELKTKLTLFYKMND